MLTHTSGLPDYYDALEKESTGTMPDTEQAMRFLAGWGEPLFPAGRALRVLEPRLRHAGAGGGAGLRAALRRAFSPTPSSSPLGMTSTVVRDSSRAGDPTPRPRLHAEGRWLRDPRSPPAQPHRGLGQHLLLGRGPGALGPRPRRPHPGAAVDPRGGVDAGRADRRGALPIRLRLAARRLRRARPAGPPHRPLARLLELPRPASRAPATVIVLSNIEDFESEEYAGRIVDLLYPTRR